MRLRASRNRHWRSATICLVGLALLPIACDAFNPAFLSLLDTNDAGTFASIENAPGHVVLAFINNAEVGEQLVAYLESPAGGGLVFTDAEKRSLRPRLRFRVEAVFVGGSQQIIEFVSGSSKLVAPDFDAEAFPDLNQNDLENVVVLCDVASIQLLPGAAIEVFVPAQLNEYERVDVVNAQGGLETDFQLRAQIDPQFSDLQVDDTDEDGNVVLRRNIGTRDVPAPINNPQCGIVIVFTINGVLSVPFLEAADEVNPSYDGGDEATIAAIGGRFEFTVNVIGS